MLVGLWIGIHRQKHKSASMPPYKTENSYCWRHNNKIKIQYHRVASKQLSCSTRLQNCWTGQRQRSFLWMFLSIWEFLLCFDAGSLVTGISSAGQSASCQMDWVEEPKGKQREKHRKNTLKNTTLLMDQYVSGSNTQLYTLCVIRNFLVGCRWSDFLILESIWLCSYSSIFFLPKKERTF